jgi:hypothetical protein
MHDDRCKCVRAAAAAGAAESSTRDPRASFSDFFRGVMIFFQNEKRVKK